MASRITAIAVNCTDPPALAAWWAEVLGHAVLGTEDGVVTIGPPGQEPKGAHPVLDFVPVPDPTPGRRRLHLDLNATDRSQAEELDRLLALGATPVDVGQGPLTEQVTWHVLADPEGNEFCLLASTVAPLSGGAPRR
ncbi:VOC family protein [Modestobacter sp. SSW1-42]|uniref:VOC family protein n=1 Tax=Modestobacter sp. SSW1-42 TaxID=596372 RepID=UPI0039864464